MIVPRPQAEFSPLIDLLYLADQAEQEQFCGFRDLLSSIHMTFNRADGLEQEENLIGGHRAIDQRNLQLARATADCVRADPAKLEVARANLHRLIERGVGGGIRNRYLAYWKRLFDTADADRILAELEREDEWGNALRQAHPFTGILPPGTREKIFDAYESK